LKHPVKQIDYVEPDPLLTRLIGEYGSGLTRQELYDTLKSVFPHVRIIPGDVNLYLASASKSLMSVSAAGLLYGGDLLGSLIESVLLLPSLGLKITCFILETIKGGSFILVLLHARYANKQR